MPKIIVGIRWVIFCPKNQEEHRYAWGLGHTFNNVVEAYTLYQGLRQTVNLGIHEVIDFGDSLNSIHHRYSESLPSDTKLSQIFKQIYPLYQFIPKKNCICFLQSNNSKANHMASLGLVEKCN